MKVLITGGCGYVGGRLAQYLASQTEYEILVGSRQKIDSLSWLPSAEAVRTNWESAVGLRKACNGVDAVVHLAGMNAQDCVADPVAALEVNAVATARMVKAAVRERVRRFIYISTAHVYHSHLAGVITEDTCPVNLHPYATSHRSGEDVVLAANQRGEIEGIVIRLSNAYGAPAHKDANCWMLLVNDLCRQAVMSKHIVLKSSGMQRRDFVPLADVCHAINHLLHLPLQGSTRSVFNVGGEWAPTVWEIAGLIQERCAAVLGFRPELERITPQNDEASDELDYRLDTLRQSGFQPDLNKEVEIDQQLEFCKASFCQ